MKFSMTGREKDDLLILRNRGDCNGRLDCIYI